MRTLECFHFNFEHTLHFYMLFTELNWKYKAHKFICNVIKTHDCIFENNSHNVFTQCSEEPSNSNTFTKLKSNPFKVYLVLHNFAKNFANFIVAN